AIAFAPDGKLWVVNEGAANPASLLRYDRAAVVAGGAVAAEVTITAPSPGCCLFDLAFFGDFAYVTQSNFGATDRVLKYPLASLAVSGTPVATPLANASFDVPAGLEFDPQGRLWVSNNAFSTPASTSVVRIDTTTGAVDRSFTNVPVSGRNALIRPEGLAFDAFGSLWVGNNGEQTIVAYSAAQLAGAGGAVVPAHLIDVSPGSPLIDGTFGGVAFDSIARLWANYQRSPFEVREYLVTSANGGASYTSTLGQVLTNATTFPGFGGLAFWPVPSTVHRSASGSLAATIAVQQDVAVSGRTSDRYTWIDADGEPRSAALTHNTTPGGGSLRQYTYRIGAVTRTVGVTDSGFSVGAGAGFGYVVSHLGGYNGNGDGMLDRCAGVVPVESPLGYAFTGNFQRLAAGRHHAIHRFTLDYPLYGCATNGGPITLYPMAVTIDWFFATGRDHPLWAATLDISSAPNDAVRADSRSPYGELLFDGSATSAAHSVIAGVAWGDGRRFTTTSSPVTYNSSWTWNAPNTVPFVKLWTTAVDATMGMVQTQTKAQHEAGGYFGAYDWDKTSASNPAGCSPARFGPLHEMPCDFNWPYQSLNYELNSGAPDNSTNGSRLAWGTNFGFIGQDQFVRHGSEFYGGPDPTTFADGHPRQNYSTYIVLDTHSSGAVEAQVAEIEAVQATTFTSVPAGAVRTQGQAGPNDLSIVTYAPAGWDHVYGVWSVTANANAADVNFAVAAGSLRNPILDVRNWIGTTLPASVTLNGALLVQDVDYFPSIIDEANQLLITLKRTLAGANNRVVVAQ
ncbi:MAG TPA: hypothetical protein VND91_07160, partial [Candidatus Saccharimonadia bacterium]|nr:hypothetical protein [Candidatus Saccharimonadia bacterium]